MYSRSAAGGDDAGPTWQKRGVIDGSPQHLEVLPYPESTEIAMLAFSIATDTKDQRIVQNGFVLTLPESTAGLQPRSLQTNKP